MAGEKPKVYERLIEEMKRVRDEAMPQLIIDEYRGSRSAGQKLENIRNTLDEAADALADQDETRALDTFGVLRTL